MIFCIYRLTFWTTLTSAPNSIKVSTTWIWPLLAARCKGVHLFLDINYVTWSQSLLSNSFTFWTTLMSAPNLIKISTMSTWPFWAAICKGVYPSFTIYIKYYSIGIKITSWTTLMSAPDLIKVRTTSTWPSWAARCKGVHLLYTVKAYISTFVL